MKTRFSMMVMAFALVGLAAGSARAAGYQVADQASCGALPVSPAPTWTAATSTCSISSNLSLAPGDTLTIASGKRLDVAANAAVLNNGGTITATGNWTGGGLENRSGGHITNSGFWSIANQSNETIVNDATSSIVVGNQFFVSNGSLQNAGTISISSFGLMGVSPGMTWVNSGTISNAGRVDLQGTLTSSGTITNTGTIQNDCGSFTNTGAYTGGLPVGPICWKGPSGGVWTTAANWNTNTVPVAGDDVAIRSGATVHINVSLTRSGDTEITLSTLAVDAGAVVTNTGTITNAKGGNFSGTTKLISAGVFINDGTILNNDTISNTGSFTNGGMIDASAVIGVINNGGEFINSAGASILGGIANTAAGVFDNYGSFDMHRLSNSNAGSFVNETAGTLRVDNALSNDAGGTIDNYGTIDVEHVLTLPGGITNQAGAFLQNESGGTISITAPDAFVINKGAVLNFSTFSNGGIVDNSGGICGEPITGNAISGTPEVSSCTPVASAGSDQTVDEGRLVVLDGSLSFEPLHRALSYSWTQVAGPGVVLAGAQSQGPSFSAPYVDVNTTLTFELVVQSADGQSAPALVNVVVKQINNPPVADAGDDVTVKEGAAASLDGTNSYDPDGDAIVSYRWTQVAGPAVELLPSADVGRPSFSTPFTSSTVLVFKLVVSDGKEPSTPSSGADSSLEDTVAVTVVPNSAPTANAGADITRGEGTAVVLDGTASGDPDAGDTITFAWLQTAGPLVVLSDPTSRTPSFEAPFVGSGGATLAFTLVVTDNDPVNPLSSSDDVVVNLLNTNDPPNCALAQPSVAQLWPPDHKMMPVDIVGINDDHIPASSIVIRVVGITQDETVDDGDRATDATVRAGDTRDTALLRAERQGSGNGRVYRIDFTASDGFEACEGAITVAVPKARSQPAIDDGQLYDSLSP